MRTNNILNSQRNLKLRYFEQKLKAQESTIKEVIGLFENYNVRSMSVVVEESKYDGDIYGPDSPFCFKESLA